jgi:pyruvate-formate lyase
MLNPAIAQAVVFTDTYKKYADAPRPIREAMCNKIQYPGLLPGPRPGDTFAGRCRGRRVTHVGTFAYFGMPDYTPENNTAGKHGGYCFDFSAAHALAKTDEERETMAGLEAFWRGESNQAIVRANTDLVFDSGFSGATDLDRVVRKGLPGLLADVNAMPDGDFRTGLLLALESVADTFRFYQRDAGEKGLDGIAKNIANLLERAPATLAEALQLILILELLFHERHYEIFQLDVAVGDLYASEIDGGALTEEQAVCQIRAFFEMINENGDTTVCRLVMGGKNRRNAENADRFIKAALMATQRHNRVTPQVTLRIYGGMDPRILGLAYDTVRETGTFPLLYNDDAILPGVAEAFGVSLEEAEGYYPVGCGEFILAPHGPALLITNWNIPRMADAAIRDYAESPDGEASFDGLYAFIMGYAARHAEKLARYVRLVIDTHNERNTFLIASLLINDCITRSKPILEGGARYVGVSVMGHGYTNAADGLTAIKQLVYDEGKYTLAEVIAALDANFDGCGDMRRDLLGAPKYGNDDPDADQMVTRLWRDIGRHAKKAGAENGLDFHTLASANPHGHYMGKEMGATADGRLSGTPYAICNAPTAGNDKNGLTALMNSIIRGTPANGGATTNFKISREFFTREREKFEALMATYWEGGGQQASFAVLNKGDLEAALKEPEKYPHLMIRMGGWTARFIDLEPFIQQEILARTLY